MKSVSMYTDGACIGNPGPGGYGVVLLYQGRRKELSGGYRLTTNNRMELMAAIVGLRAIKERCKVALYSDSQYLVHAMDTEMVYQWQAKGRGRKKGKQLVPNADLWQELIDLAERHEVRFVWVRGHAGEMENERAHDLSMVGASGHDLPVDYGYEQPPSPPQASLLD